MTESRYFAKTFYADFSKLKDDKIIENIAAELETDRLERIVNARRTDIKAQILAGGLIIKYALREVFSLEKFGVERNVHGKPYIKDAPGKFFNISHSGDIVICTVSDTECGIDIEKIDQAKSFVEIAERFFSIYEKNAILLSPNQSEAFCRLWTLRESYVKMRGIGFEVGLSSLKCDFHRGKASIYEKDVLQEDAFFDEIKNIEGHRASLCTNKEVVHTVMKIEL
jgi:4'-phosphopantetheinyl transferase